MNLKRLPNRIMLILIAGYQKALSPLLPKACRFTPSCSQYGYQAFTTYPFGKALRLTVTRVLRCNPFCRGGYDPLP